MDSIKWYINNYIHVSTSDRALIREFYNRIKASGQAYTRDQRKAIYNHALIIHHKNREDFNWIMGTH